MIQNKDELIVGRDKVHVELRRLYTKEIIDLKLIKNELLNVVTMKQRKKLI